MESRVIRIIRIPNGNIPNIPPNRRSLRDPLVRFRDQECLEQFRSFGKLGGLENSTCLCPTHVLVRDGRNADPIFGWREGGEGEGLACIVQHYLCGCGGSSDPLDVLFQELV